MEQELPVAPSDEARRQHQTSDILLGTLGKVLISQKFIWSIEKERGFWCRDTEKEYEKSGEVRNLHVPNPCQRTLWGQAVQGGEGDKDMQIVGLRLHATEVL